MAAVILGCRLSVAAVFLVAATAKLAQRGQASDDPRVSARPRSLPASAAVLLGFAELAIGVCLLVDRTVVAAALAALVVLVAGAMRMIWVLARGLEEDCGCFGSLRPTRVGRRTIARNGLLAGAAALVVVDGGEAGPSPAGWIAHASTLELAGLAAVACAAGVAVVAVLLTRRAAARRLVRRLSAQLADQRGRR